MRCWGKDNCRWWERYEKVSSICRNVAFSLFSPRTANAVHSHQMKELDRQISRQVENRKVVYIRLRTGR